MTTRFAARSRHHAAAFVLALASTLLIFAGVNGLSAHSPYAGAVLAQAQSLGPAAPAQG